MPSGVRLRAVVHWLRGTLVCKDCGAAVIIVAPRETHVKQYNICSGNFSCASVSPHRIPISEQV